MFYFCGDDQVVVFASEAWPGEEKFLRDVFVLWGRFYRGTKKLLCGLGAGGGAVDRGKEVRVGR